MNRFRTCTRYFAFIGMFFLSTLANFTSAQSLNGENPFHTRGNHIHADIDTTNQLVYVLMQDELWQYHLESSEWLKLPFSGITEEPITDYQFGFNAQLNSLFLWASGIGEVYEIDLDQKDLKLQRIDFSFLHKNQFGHFPFFRNGILYAFGGYGMWEWHNIITYFNYEIKEWNLQNVQPQSTFPDGRIPYYGRYIPENDRLYIIGGEGSEGNRQDDKYTLNKKFHDVWQYAFDTEQWVKLTDIDFSNTSFYTPSMDLRIGLVGKNSASFYSNKSKLWYLPVSLDENSIKINYLKPFHVLDQKELPVIELDLRQSEDFILSNYLYNPKTNEVIIIGMDWLTNITSLPVKVIRIPEEALLQDIDIVISERKQVYRNAFSLIGFSLTIFVIILIFYKRKKSENSQLTTFGLSDIREFDWLNDDEKRALQILIQARKPLETMELEEQIWPEIDNYDYRRKLRNTTIKSINNKFEYHYPHAGIIIYRKKDPNDNRRFRYSLNKDLITNP